ncbi:MAG: hypothetical protein H6732_20145 [Alphaproteobacteria bacterium]|nr:hypothetical protein [Alphaproteobacteria bacterium]
MVRSHAAVVLVLAAACTSSNAVCDQATGAGCTVADGAWVWLDAQGRALFEVVGDPPLWFDDAGHAWAVDPWTLQLGGPVQPLRFDDAACKDAEPFLALEVAPGEAFRGTWREGTDVVERGFVLEDPGAVLLRQESASTLLPAADYPRGRCSAGAEEVALRAARPEDLVQVDLPAPLDGVPPMRRGPPP